MLKSKKNSASVAVKSTAARVGGISARDICAVIHLTVTPALERFVRHSTEKALFIESRKGDPNAIPGYKNEHVVSAMIYGGILSMQGLPPFKVVLGDVCSRHRSVRSLLRELRCPKIGEYYVHPEDEEVGSDDETANEGNGDDDAVDDEDGDDNVTEQLDCADGEDEDYEPAVASEDDGDVPHEPPAKKKKADVPTVDIRSAVRRTK